jgi:hypothetical protein
MVGQARLDLEVTFGSESGHRKRIRVVSLAPEADMLIVGIKVQRSASDKAKGSLQRSASERTPL